MPENAEVDWLAIARKRWPLFEIRGDGPFVAVSRGKDTVSLFSSVFERTGAAPPNSEFLTLRPPDRTRKTASG